VSHSFALDYSDPEEMEAAQLAANAQVVPLGRGPFCTRVVRVELEHLWLTRIHEGTPCLKHISLDPARAFITFLTEPGPDVIVRGLKMPADGMMRHSRDHSYYERTTGAAHWGSVSMPVEEMIAAGRALAGIDLTPPPDALVVTPPSGAFAKFQRLHSEIAVLAKDAPQIIANPQTAHGLEQSLVEALVTCLCRAEVQEQRWADQCHATVIHATVMRRFHRLLEHNPDRAIYVPEICAAIGVPERTLRLCCQEHLAMSPKHYLALRRMHLARRALLKAQSRATTVTEVAMRFGFWHFGRFATEYRALFGESPSATLRRPPDCCAVAQ
jgi:AraC-like DNA-binding protein